ncbi:MAG: hypothetical protein ACKOBP_10555, partial [Planctomycetia bacterium]
MFCRITCVAIVYLAFGCGCAPSAPSASPAKTAAGKAHDDHGDHDHDDHDHGHDHGDHQEPETVAEGIAQLEKLCADAKA